MLVMVKKLRKSFYNEVKAKVVVFKEQLAAVIFRIKKKKRNKIKKLMKSLPSLRWLVLRQVPKLRLMI